MTARDNLEHSIDAWIEENKNTLAEEICELIRIRSVADKDDKI